MGCLDEAAVLDLVEGRLSADEETAAKAHVAACDACRELVAEVARSLGAADATADSTGPLARGNTIGRYVIVDVVGVGGMGVVYAAYDPELDRKVAVKLLRRDVSTSPGKVRTVGELGRRLLREAQAMAKLSHPNVVSVYDAGTTPDGQVFVAMEFVAGTSLGKWLNERPRAWRDVLDVYTEAGHGLAAAHEAGLVHRDFKPDNVMVGTRPSSTFLPSELVGAGERVLVTDFGLARPIGRPSDPRIPLGGKADAQITQAGAIAGTPAYMAPEQFRGETATAASDQFAFCVALYEGLYGARPFEGKTFEQIESAVLAGRVRETPKSAPVPARVHAAILRGLSTSPGARHPSMDALLAAIQPRRFKMRRRFIIALAVVGIALSAALGYRGARRERLVCTGAEAKLGGVWDDARKAQISAAFAKTGKPYAADAWRGAEKAIDAYARGWVAMRTDACEATRLRGEQSEDMLDRRVECLDAHLRQLSALTRLFSEADGAIVSSAVEASLALPNLAECANTVALKAGVRLPSEPEKAARVQNARIHLAQAKALEDAGKYDEARLLVEPVVRDAREIGYLPLEAEALALDGSVSARLADMRRAERSLRDAAEAALASDDDAVAARAFVDLVYFVGGKEARYDEAHQWSRYAQLAIERLGGSDELEADRLDAFSIITWHQGKGEEALAELDRALHLYQRVLGNDHPKIAHTLDGIAAVYYDLGRMSEAYDLDAQALAIAERALGQNHPHVSLYLNNAGNELVALGKYGDALPVLERALHIAEQTGGSDSPETVAPLDTIGSVLTLMGKYDDALARLEQAKANLERAGRRENPDFAAVTNDIGTAELARGRASSALDAHTEALAVLERVVGKEHPDYAVTLMRIADAHLALGKAKDARAEDERALAIIDGAGGGDTPAAAQVALSLGRARAKAGDPAAALEPLERAVKIRVAHPGDPRDLADARFALAQALWASGKDKDRARALAKDARGVYERAPWLRAQLDATDAWLAQIDGRVTKR